MTDKERPDFYCLRGDCQFGGCPRHPTPALIEIRYHPERAKDIKFRLESEVPELCRGKIKDTVKEMMGC